MTIVSPSFYEYVNVDFYCQLPLPSPLPNMHPLFVSVLLINEVLILRWLLEVRIDDMSEDL